jgi:hypothetical protein
MLSGLVGFLLASISAGIGHFVWVGDEAMVRRADIPSAFA